MKVFFKKININWNLKLLMKLSDNCRSLFMCLVVFFFIRKKFHCKIFVATQSSITLHTKCLGDGGAFKLQK